MLERFRKFEISWNAHGNSHEIQSHAHPVHHSPYHHLPRHNSPHSGPFRPIGAATLRGPKPEMVGQSHKGISIVFQRFNEISFDGHEWRFHFSWDLHTWTNSHVLGRTRMVDFMGIPWEGLSETQEKCWFQDTAILFANVIYNVGWTIVKRVQ